MTPFLALAVLAMSLGAAVFQNAGALPNWNWSVCGVGGGAAVYFLITRNTSGRALDRRTLAPTSDNSRDAKPRWTYLSRKR